MMLMLMLMKSFWPVGCSRAGYLPFLSLPFLLFSLPLLLEAVKAVREVNGVLGDESCGASAKGRAACAKCLFGAREEDSGLRENG